MEILGNQQKSTGISANALRIWGMVFLAAGIVGRGVLQNHILGFSGMNTQQMLEVMQSSEAAMNLATLSIALQAVETCAVPVFVMLLVEGVMRTSDRRQYFLRVLGLALLTEIPYNLAMGRGVLDFGSRNPVFGLVLGFVLIYFYDRYKDRGFQNVLIKILVTAAALVWVKMLNIEFGGSTLLILIVLWPFRKKLLYRCFIGASAAMVCAVISPYFLAAPMSFLAIHMCNWERNEDNRIVNYLMYPALLLLAGMVAIFVL